VNRHRWALVLLAFLAVNALSCASDDPAVNTDNPGPTVTLPAPGAAGGPAVSGSLVVFAPTELTAVGTRLASGFMKQNPKAHVTFRAEATRLSMLRILGQQPADIFISDAKSISDFRAYLHNLPSSQGLAREVLVIVVPKHNPGKVLHAADLGDPPPSEAICTPPVMLFQTQVPLDDLAVPINKRSKANCGSETVDAVAKGDLKGAIVPGSAAGYIRANQIDRIRLPLTGNVVVPYSIVVVKDSAVANGFVNFAHSDRGRQLINESGYDS
jgi:ABC-type molybdate transport system substrate-binding protein